MYHTYHYHAVITYGFLIPTSIEISGIIPFNRPIFDEKDYDMIKSTIKYKSGKWNIRGIVIKSLTLISKE